MKSLKIHCLVHTSRVRMSMRCCPNAVLFPSMLRCYLKLNEYSKGLTFTLIMPNNTFQSQSKDEQEWYVELLQKLQLYVILQQQEELALGLFNRCKALTIQNTSRDSDGLFFQHMERPSRDPALRTRQKQKISCDRSS